jgi:hypothetical protein
LVNLYLKEDNIKMNNIIYENDQKDAKVYDNLLFFGCSTCFERYFRSSSGASNDIIYENDQKDATV